MAKQTQTISFTCNECGNDFMAQKREDKTIKCPECGSTDCTRADEWEETEAEEDVE